jgi:hypothetical protein
MMAKARASQGAVDVERLWLLRFGLHFMVCACILRAVGRRCVQLLHSFISSGREL